MEQLITSASNFSILLRTAAFHAEPGTKVEIVDRWQEGGIKSVRLRHPESRSTARYQIVQSFSLGDRKYLVLQSRATLEEDAHIVVALADENHVFALTPEQLQEVEAQIGRERVHNEFDQVQSLIGVIEDRTKRIKFLQSYLEEALTESVSLGTRAVQAGEKLSIDRKWHHFGTIFLTLKRPSEGESHEFRLVWIVELGKAVYAIIAYPADTTAESSVVPRIVIRIPDRDSMSPISASELESMRNTVIDMICGRNEIIPYEAARHIGAIESPGTLR